MLEWSAPEFEYRPKSVHWYWASVVIAVLLIAAAAWQKNFLFGFFVLVAEILVLVWANRTPPLHTFTLTEKGIVFGKNARPLNDFESFSSEDHWSYEWSSVMLYFKRRFRPAIKVHVPKDMLSEIESALRKALPKIEHEDTLVETLEHFVGF